MTTPTSCQSMTPARCAVSATSTAWFGSMTNGCAAPAAESNTTRWPASREEAATMRMDDLLGTFSVDASGYLLRQCQPRSGKAYEHRCELKTLEEVAYTIDELAGAPFTYECVHEIMNAAPDADWPFTQIAVAIAFLK